MPQQKRILAVDDDRVIRKVVQFTLQGAGFAVTSAQDGRDAWEILQAEDFDLVVTDHQMPEMTGEMLCQRMRQVDRLKHVPVILLTGKGSDLDLGRFREELGVSEVMSKPMSTKALVAAVQACLTASRKAL